MASLQLPVHSHQLLRHPMFSSMATVPWLPPPEQNNWKTCGIISKLLNMLRFLWVFQFFQWFFNFSNKTIGFSNFPMILEVFSNFGTHLARKRPKSLENWKTLRFYWKNWKIIGKIGKRKPFQWFVHFSNKTIGFSNFSNDLSIFPIKP